MIRSLWNWCLSFWKTPDVWFEGKPYYLSFLQKPGTFSITPESPCRLLEVVDLEDLSHSLEEASEHNQIQIQQGHSYASKDLHYFFQNDMDMVCDILEKCSGTITDRYIEEMRQAYIEFRPSAKQMDAIFKQPLTSNYLILQLRCNMSIDNLQFSFHLTECTLLQ